MCDMMLTGNDGADVSGSNGGDVQQPADDEPECYHSVHRQELSEHDAAACGYVHARKPTVYVSGFCIGC